VHDSSLAKLRWWLDFRIGSSVMVVLKIDAALAMADRLIG